MLGGVRPKTDGRVARDEVGTHMLHDRANGALGDAIERVHVRRARGLVYGFGLEEFLELAREELAGVVAVQRADYADGLIFPARRIRVELCDVALDERGSLALGLHKVYGLEARVIVDEHQHVLVLADGGTTEGTDDVCVYSTADVARRVAGPGVRDVGGVGFCAVSAAEGLGFGEALGSVGGQGWEGPELVRVDVEAPMHDGRGVVGAKGFDV